MAGKQHWYFADGYLPAASAPGAALEAHEALMILNLNPHGVTVSVTIYFSDREPLRNVALRVEAERVVSLRLDKPDEFGGAVIPRLTQYALAIHASHPVVCQFGRLDTTQSAMSYYVGIGVGE